jgi:hypothetical protein
MLSFISGMRNQASGVVCGCAKYPHGFMIRQGHIHYSRTQPPPPPPPEACLKIVENHANHPYRSVGRTAFERMSMLNMEITISRFVLVWRIFTFPFHKSANFFPPLFASLGSRFDTRVCVRVQLVIFNSSCCSRLRAWRDLKAASTNYGCMVWLEISRPRNGHRETMLTWLQFLKSHTHRLLFTLVRVCFDLCNLFLWHVC